MRLLFSFLLIASLSSIAAHAQMTEDPTDWQYRVKKVSSNTYQLVFELKLDKGWHIWSMKPGGDGFQITPGFIFDTKPALTLKGNIVEKGNLITANMEGVDGAVNYYSKQVEYVQTVTVKGKLKITGEHTYQVCNDNMCLPPKTQKFVFNIN